MNNSFLSNIAGAALLVACCGIESDVSAQNALILNVDSAKTLITRALFGALLEQLGRDIDGGDSYQQSTIRDAQVAAIHLNAFINNGERVTAACVAQAVNVIQALLLTNPSNQAQMVKTPTYYTYKLFQAHQNGKKIPAALTTAVYDKDTAGSRILFPLLSAAATVDSAGTVNITISNSHLTADQKLTITLKSVKAYGRVAGQFIWAPAATAYNDFGKTEQVNIRSFADSNVSLSGSALTVTVPAKAVVLLQVHPVTTGAVTPGHAFGPKKQTRHLMAGRGGTINILGVAGLKPGTLEIFNPGGRLVAETAFSGGSAIAMGLKAQGALYFYMLKDRSGNAQISGKLLLVN
jgi:hypothetical protein